MSLVHIKVEPTEVPNTVKLLLTNPTTNSLIDIMIFNKKDWPFGEAVDHFCRQQPRGTVFAMVHNHDGPAIKLSTTTLCTALELDYEHKLETGFKTPYQRLNDTCQMYAAQLNIKL